MRFLVQIGGTHEEGPEAKHRLSKIVHELKDKLTSNGFMASEVLAEHNAETPPSEFEQKLEELTRPGPAIPGPMNPGPSPTPVEPEAEQQAAQVAVNFASDAATELADSNDLTDADFAGLTPSGALGFTTDDVRKVIAKRK